jgi:hypothetical protein
VNAIDDEIIRLRVNGRLSAAKIAQIMQVTEPYIEKAIARLADAGRIEEPGMAVPANLGIPPSKLPEGSAGYDCAARWLEQWGHTVVWRRFGKACVPEIDGRLSNVVALCEAFFEGRRGWVAKRANGSPTASPA